jgi:hypothetical protein
MKSHHPILRTRLVAGAVAALWATLGTSAVARADDSAAAQALFDQAKKAMAVHEYAEACPKFAESFKLQEAVGTLLNLADCYEHEGKLASAWSKFLDVASKARVAGQAQRARIGRDRAAALAPKLSNLVVDVPSGSRAEGLEVRRDGTVVGGAEWGVMIPADSGSHTIEASAPGRKPWSQTVSVLDGATTSHVTVPDLERLPPDAKPVAEAPAPVVAPVAAHRASGRGSAQRISGIFGLSLGVAGAGLGATFGLLSKAKHDTAHGECPDHSCGNAQGVSDWADATNFGNISTVAFIVGGVGLAAGVTLLLTAPKSEDTEGPVARVVVGPGDVALMGTW